MKIKLKNRILWSANFLLILIIGNCYAVDSLGSLLNTYSIKDNLLITECGEKYCRYPYESKLHFDLAYYMKDLKAADSVYKAYKSIILPVLIKLPEDGTSNRANEVFSKALIKTCLLFGNPIESPEEAFFYTLNQQGKEGFQWIEEYSKEVKEFVKEANTPLYFLKSKKNKDIFNVVLITTTSSGGNYSVAESIAAFLEKNKKIKTTIIDVEDIAKEVDPIMLATNTYTYDMIYSSIFQKTNDFTVISGRKKINREIHQFIPNMLLARLKQKVASLNPDFIISTRSYTSDDITLTSLGVPFRLFHPDFELCPSLISYYKNIPSKSIKFWIPSNKPSMFRPLFEDAGQLEHYNEKDDYATLMSKLSNFLEVPVDRLKSQFELIGYPCSNFFKIDDEVVLDGLRQKWEVSKDEIVIFIVMGKHGTHTMKEIFDQLSETNSRFPLKYIFICGKNNSLKDELNVKLRESKNIKNKFVIHGLLSPSEMNEVMNISSMGISKAGGGTVIESYTTNKHLLLMNWYPWEELNASYLIGMNLATKYESTKPLIEQIENILSLTSSIKKEKSETENWKEKIMWHLEKHLHFEKKSNQKLGS